VDLRYVKHQCRRAKIALRSLSQKIIPLLLSYAAALNERWTLWSITYLFFRFLGTLKDGPHERYSSISVFLYSSYSLHSSLGLTRPLGRSHVTRSQHSFTC